MDKAIIWCRVSTTQQEFESQKDALILQASKDGFSKENLIIIGEAGASAIKMNELYQKEVNELLDAIDNDSNVKVIYVWEISRLARNEGAFYMMKERILEKHIQLICTVPELKLYNSDGKLNSGAEITLSLLITLARQEMEIKKERFSRGKRQKALDNKYSGGVVPFGYIVDKDKNIVPDWKDDKTGEADIVEQIFTMYENGFSQVQIAKDFQARGVTHNHFAYLGKEPHPITLSFVHQVLTSELLTGKASEEKIITQKVDGQIRTWISYSRTYPAIISKERFKKCRDIAQKNNTSINKARNIYFAYKLIKCPVCGARFLAVGQQALYKCIDALNVYKNINGTDVPRCSNRDTISINVMDSLLWHLAQKLEVEYRLSSAKDEIEGYKSKIDEYKVKYDNISNRLNQLIEEEDRLSVTFVKGKIKEDTYNRMSEDIESRRRSINNERLEYKEAIEHLQALIDGISSQYKSDGVSAFIEAFDKPLDMVMAVQSIENDKIRYEIVQKHIREVSIEKTKALYKYKCHSEPKEKQGTLISIFDFKGNVYKYIYIPSAGNGKGYIKVNDDGSLTPVEIPYLRRFWNYHRDNKRAILSKERQQQKIENLQKRQAQYLTVTEVAKALGVRGHKVFYDINHGYLKAEQRADRLYYITIEEFQNYKQWLSNRGMYKGKRKATSE